jgi:predicted O-methyltransferase YrrM
MVPRWLKRAFQAAPDADLPTDARLAIEGVEGMISLVEAALLYGLAARVAEGSCIVEVGSYRGRSAVALALGAPPGVRVYAVDPHETFIGVLGGEFGPADRVSFLENVERAGVGDRVTLLNTSSDLAAEGWTERIGLLWIDGDHRYESVRRDWLAWLPQLDAASIVAFHDVSQRTLGPWELTRELLETGAIRSVERVGLTEVFELA